MYAFNAADMSLKSLSRVFMLIVSSLLSIGLFNFAWSYFKKYFALEVFIIYFLNSSKSFER